MEKQKKPIYKKWWFWAIVVIIVIGVIGSGENTTTTNSNVNSGIEQSSTSNSNTNLGKEQNTNATEQSAESNETQSEENKEKKPNKVEVSIIDFSAMKKEEITAWCNNNKIKCDFKEEYSDAIEKGQFIRQSVNSGSKVYEGNTVAIVYSLGKRPTKEYENALKNAESYSKMMHMSKKAIYNQLVSEYGENFPADAAQYAIDNIKADWNANALETAKAYQNTMSMSKKAIYEQLISEYGEQFTKEEAQYAIDHLED